MKVNMSRKSGFTLVEIMIVVAIIGLLAAIAIPNFVKARATSQRNACIANLKQMQGAVATWALETKAAVAAVAPDAGLYGVANYIRSKPLCPGGGVYANGSVAVDPTCTLAPAPDLHILP